MVAHPGKKISPTGKQKNKRTRMATGFSRNHAGLWFKQVMGIEPIIELLFIRGLQRFVQPFLQPVAEKGLNLDDMVSLINIL